MPILLGGNPSTMDDNWKEHWLGRRLSDMFSDKRNSVHNCHGLGQRQCVTDGYRKDESDLHINKERTIYDLNRK